MTVIVGLKTKAGVYLGCDSQGSAGWDKTDRKDQKIFTAHGIGYGFTSSYRMGQILRYHSTEVLSTVREKDVFGYVVTHLVPMWRNILGEHGYKTNIHGQDEGGIFLIAIDGHLFKIDSDFQVSEGDLDYAATGCGEGYALGALYGQASDLAPVDRIQVAIESAKAFSNGCGGQVHTLMV